MEAIPFERIDLTQQKQTKNTKKEEEKIMKKFVSLLLALLMVSALVACSSGNTASTTQATTQTEKAPVDKSKVSISVGSGTSGGAFYMVGAALAQAIQNHAGYTASSEATGGTSENIRIVADQTTTIGMGMCDDVIAAYKGERDYAGSPASNLRVLMSGQTNTFHIIVRADSDIKNLEDIKGKRVSLGPSGAPWFGPDMIEATTGYVKDKDYTGQYLGHNQAADALQNGDIDVLIATLAYPASAYANLALSVDVRFISLTDEQMNKALAAHPAWKDQGIPAGTYKGQDEATRVPAVPVWLFTYADMDEEVIYDCVKAILENSDEMATVHADAGKYRLETATDGLGDVHVHPGALKYFQEKGVMN